MEPEPIAFSTTNGYYEYTRLPLKRGHPRFFPRMYDLILEELIYKYCLVYLDAKIIFPLYWKNTFYH